MKPSILLVEDDHDCAQLLSQALENEYHVVIADDIGAAVHALMSRHFELVVTDVLLGVGSGLELCREMRLRWPTIPVVLMTGNASVTMAVEALRVGARDFLTKPVDIKNLRRCIAQNIAPTLQKALPEVSARCGMVGTSPGMSRACDLIELVAPTPTSILITGESGTGKELVARAIHASSGRTGPFVAVNCAAIPAALLESEFFGHVRGSFTDAKESREGLFLQANGGTLFLDEIGEIPLDLQAKLLRALQERQVRRVGGVKEESFDARVLTATNRNLFAEVAAGHFREDLYYRINVVNIALPPLRERGNDILLLARVFSRDLAKTHNTEEKPFSLDARRCLLAYDWPGNVRELENSVEHALAVAKGAHIDACDFPERMRGFQASSLPLELRDQDIIPLEEVEKRYVKQVLDATGGNKTKAAKLLGVDRRTLYRRMARMQSKAASETSAANR